MPPQPTVLLIAGAGRSGSTLLDRILGGIPNYATVGELVFLFNYCVLQNERCGCGEWFAECEHWTKVGQFAFGGWDPEHATAVQRAHESAVRLRRLPSLLRSHGSADFDAHLRLYREAMRQIYAAVAEAAGASVIIDASKHSTHGLALTASIGDEPIDVRVLQLVRDPRGVAYSWGKKGLARPSAREERREMPVWTPRRAASKWTYENALSRVVAHRATRSTIVRYEDLIPRPAEVVEAALQRLDLGPVDLSHIVGSSVQMQEQHGVNGNPGRFDSGTINLKPDEEWRTNFPATSQGIVNSLSWPTRLLIHRAYSRQERAR